MAGLNLGHFRWDSVLPSNIALLLTRLDVELLAVVAIALLGVGRVSATRTDGAW